MAVWMKKHDYQLGLDPPKCFKVHTNGPKEFQIVLYESKIVSKDNTQMVPFDSQIVTDALKKSNDSSMVANVSQIV